MTGSNRTQHLRPSRAPSYVPRLLEVDPLLKVDPLLLGRPIHLLSAFGARLQARLRDHLAAFSSRREMSGTQVRSVTFTTTAPADPHLQWRQHPVPLGTISVGFDRSIVLEQMHRRYPRSCYPVIATTGNITNPTNQASKLAQAEAHQASETATERRLASALSQGFVKALLECVVDASDYTQPAQDASPAPSPTGDRSPIKPAHGLRHQPGAGLYVRCEMSRETDSPSSEAIGHTVIRRDESSMKPFGVLFFLLDDYWRDRLFSSLSHSPATTRDVCGAPLRKKINVTLTAELPRWQQPFGDLLKWKKGALLPIAKPESVNVRVQHSVLFSALIKEQHGRLSLTSFSDAD